MLRITARSGQTRHSRFLHSLAIRCFSETNRNERPVTHNFLLSVYTHTHSPAGIICPSAAYVPTSSRRSHSSTFLGRPSVYSHFYGGVTHPLTVGGYERRGGRIVYSAECEQKCLVLLNVTLSFASALLHLRIIHPSASFITKSPKKGFPSSGQESLPSTEF